MNALIPIECPRHDQVGREIRHSARSSSGKTRRSERRNAWFDSSSRGSIPHIMDPLLIDKLPSLFGKSLAILKLGSYPPTFK